MPYPSDQQRERALGVRKEQDLRRDSTYGEKEYYLPLIDGGLKVNLRKS
ncbi:MAG: hypothetical protein F6K17_05010 [Okeania sp. SIO3C4]|nr:hypothetical protein [Okeania sp. SIO3C4]